MILFSLQKMSTFKLTNVMATAMAKSVVNVDNIGRFFFVTVEDFY